MGRFENIWISTMDESRWFRDIPYMGVIWVVAEAHKLGFFNGHPDWCNLGQGQPEVGPMDGAPPRIDHVQMEPIDHAYGPVDGTDELRDAIAAHYNRLYRAGKQQYTRDNVSVASGGRLMLSRAFAALGAVRTGYQIPDYTAYEDMIDYHRHRIEPVMVEARAEDGFLIPPDRFRDLVQEHRLAAHVFSNPCNPTGRVVRGDDLGSYVQTARDEGCLLISDEFYSHFIYDGPGRPADGPVSTASCIEDVNEDPVLLIDGLTKSFRYPGWRVGWAVGPPALVAALGRTASAIDGGPGRPLQRAAIAALEPERADRETTALREVFCKKRDLMVDRLSTMGVRIPHASDSTFYVWGCLDELPEPLRDADAFFTRGLQRKVMTVPGRFFDVNPGRMRPGPSPYRSWMRFSFGPPMDNLVMGLDRLEEMVRST